jgi:hypothetical protein
MEIKIGSDGGKSCIVTITGQLSSNINVKPILFFAGLNGAPKALRLDGLQFSIQEKMGFNLFWLMPEGETRLIMPMESRGGYDLEKIQPISSPEAAVGIAITSFKVVEKNMSFFIILDLSKQ